MTNEGNTVWVKVWTPAGFSASITLSFEGEIPYADEVEGRLQAAGWLMNAPDLEAGQKAESIVTVMRREASNGAPVLDLYPAWNVNGTFGAYRFCSIYLDTAEQIAEFEAQSGLKLKDLPVYDAQAPLKRTAGKTHKCEVACKTPFEMLKAPDGEEKTLENGVEVVKPRYHYSYRVPKKPLPARPAPAPATPERILSDSKPVPAPTTSAPAPSTPSPDFTPSPDEDETPASWVQDSAAVQKMLTWAIARGICKDEAGLWSALGGKDAAQKIQTPKQACEQLLDKPTPFRKPA